MTGWIWDFWNLLEAELDSKLANVPNKINFFRSKEHEEQYDKYVCTVSIHIKTLGILDYTLDRNDFEKDYCIAVKYIVGHINECLYTGLDADTLADKAKALQAAGIETQPKDCMFYCIVFVDTIPTEIYAFKLAPNFHNACASFNAFCELEVHKRSRQRAGKTLMYSFKNGFDFVDWHETVCRGDSAISGELPKVVPLENIWTMYHKMAFDYKRKKFL